MYRATVNPAAIDHRLRTLTLVNERSQPVEPFVSQVLPQFCDRVANDVIALPAKRFRSGQLWCCGFRWIGLESAVLPPQRLLHLVAPVGDPLAAVEKDRIRGCPLNVTRSRIML